MAHLARIRCGHRSRLHQAGLTLVELMVGLAVGMLFTAGLLTLFANASFNGAHLARASAQIENGRYVAELLREDLQMAGYFGELGVAGAAWSTPDPCATVPTGFNGTTLGLPTAVRGYGAGEALGCLSNRRSGTDALAVRRVDTVSVDPATLGSANAQYHLQLSFCDTDPATTVLVFDRLGTAFTLKARGCATANRVRPYIARTYYVAACNRCGTGGDSVPTLKRVDLVGGTLVETALVEGVEALRIEYGFDTDNDGDIDSWRTTADSSGPASLWENVVALKLHYLVRSIDPVNDTALATAQTFSLGSTGTVTTAADGYLRRAYSTTVRLVNVSGAREQQ